MREDQFIGPCPAAKEFLAVNEVPEKVCGECGRSFPRDLEIIGHFHGMFGDECPLFRHQLINNSYADEFLQAAPWFGGPIHFLGLRLANGVELIWIEEEIEEQSS